MRATAARFLRHPLTRIGLCVGIPIVATSVLTMVTPHTLWTPLSYRVVMTLLAILTLLGVGRWLEDRSPAQVGLGLQGALGETAVGFGLGALLISLAVALLWVAGWYRVTGFTNDWGPVAETFIFMFAVALLEEVLTRGALFRILEEWLGSGAALLVSAAFFGFAHLGNPGASPTAALAIAIEAGALLAAAFMLTRRVWLAIGIHWSWNFFQGSVWGVPVSGTRHPALLESIVQGPALWTGGVFGPEAGLAGLLVGSAAGALLLGMAVRGGNLRRASCHRR